MNPKGLLVAVCGPSGVGKGSVLNLVREACPNVVYSISATTRSPRQGEVDGVNYFFKSMDEFKDMIDKDELAEWALYCGNYYGTPRKFIDDSLEKGQDVILEIDVVGADSIKKKYPDVVMIFILPPSFDELRRRIVGRGTENPEVIEKRMQRAMQEISRVDDFDYAIVNDDLDAAVQSIRSILISEKLRCSRNRDILKKLGLK